MLFMCLRLKLYLEYFSQPAPQQKSCVLMLVVYLRIYMGVGSRVKTSSFVYEANFQRHTFVLNALGIQLVNKERFPLVRGGGGLSHL
jgi:hypothetical protein